MDNDKTDQKIPALTSREFDIFKELSGGASPKEIAYTLKISYDTVLGHQKKLYRKLNVNAISELLAKYTIVNGVVTSKSDSKITAKFTRWREFEDELGSSISVMSKIENIQEQYITTYTIAGKLSSKLNSFSGVTAEPDQATLEAMRKMTSFSFLGDGSSYKVLITTTDTRDKGGNNHYRKVFTTKKYEMSTISVNIDELFQSPSFGVQIPFILNNVELFQLQSHSTGEFNLKIWDIKFNT
ncbi:MAG: helix-turn-helix transcriptional regulator [Treponema sp.]|jgi:DNA-binding CsgD family transcriptional regulator|nr:helix-turn-helix transcriptional regulator [Treponema sp.]